MWLSYEFHKKKPAEVLNGIYDPERPLLKDYLESAVRDIRGQGITNLIIDLRYNAGGEEELARQFLYFFTERNDLKNVRTFEDPKVLAECNGESVKNSDGEVKKTGGVMRSEELVETEWGDPVFASVADEKSIYYVPPDRSVYRERIVVLVDEHTGSAAAGLAALMQDNKLAVTVGRSTANNPTGQTGFTPFKLPRSGMIVSLPTRYVERAEPSNGEIFKPEYWVENSVEDLKTGRDSVFEKAREIISN
jgi:hypothetical protein